MSQTILVVNFGGPRNLEEIPSFLTALLTDEEVLRTPLPRFIEKRLFAKIAKKRAPLIAKDYTKIGGKSPIFDDTEAIAKEIGAFTFHRYLPETHPAFIEKMRADRSDEIIVFPLFPQFSYTTTGSIARFFSENLPGGVLDKMRWVRSYPTHPGFIKSYARLIEEAIDDKTFLLFSSHGLPQKYVTDGDPYQKECRLSYQALSALFPDNPSLLAFQSKFGPGEWLRPYTSDVCRSIREYTDCDVLIVPLSFTSDHIETLFEIEEDYLPPIREAGLQARRLPSLNRNSDWLAAIKSIIGEGPYFSHSQQLRSRVKLSM